MVPTLEPSLSRAHEVSELLDAVQSLIHPFIQSADNFDLETRSNSSDLGRTALVEYHEPTDLASLLKLNLPDAAGGKASLLQIVEQVLKYSVNTWDQGFMDKLYGSTNAVGVASELILGVLNCNVHTYGSSPALSLIEKHTSRALARLFGFRGQHAGGISQPGGSASNSTSIIVARNTLFPATKTDGYGSHRFVLFTSEHGHYSLEKAAQMFGFGSNAVRSVPVDEVGRMLPAKLAEMISKSKSDGFTPFYVNATAGTTVLGSFDPFEDIAEICKRERLWLHVDGSWGGSVVFSETLRKGRLEGIEKADSIAINPHKMLGVPMTCSFLLGKDMQEFHQANTLPAGYLFHIPTDPNEEVYDLADLTPQCGRRGDALKMFLGWTYYGRQGYAQMIEHAFSVASHLFALLSSSPNFVLVSKEPLPCLQVCFYWAKRGELSNDSEQNGGATERMARALIGKGWMIDYAPGERGKFFRVVVNRETRRETVEGLVKAIETLGSKLFAG